MESKHDDDEVICEGTGSSEDNEFDAVIGAIEEILFEGQLTGMQNAFFEKHHSLFEDSDENKLEYQKIFENYVEAMEESLESLIASKIKGFDMKRFETMLANRPDEIPEEIMDLLLSFSDFSEFKDLMIAFKRSKSQGSMAVNGSKIEE